jgi:hypothetical protein
MFKRLIFLLTLLALPVWAGDAPTITIGGATIREPSAGGRDAITLKAPALGASWNLTLPNVDGNSGQFLQTDGSGNTTWAGESDPKVGTLTNLKWCTSDGSQAICNTDAPVLTESDPKVGTLTNTKWCTSDGSQAICNTDAPVTTESDPQVGTLTNGDICTTDGSAVNCGLAPPAGSLVGTTATQALTGKDIDGGTASDTSRITIPKNTTTNLTGLTRKQGTLVYDTTANSLKVDDGATLQTVGGGGQGGINYISAYDAEPATGGLTGWTAYADAAGATPVDGTGGSPTATWTLNTSTPLRNTTSFRLTKDAANRQGEGVSYPFTLSAADLNMPVYVSFSLAASSAFVSGDVVPFIYDVTAGALVTLTGQATGNRYRGVFYTNGTSTSYRFGLHIATTNASAYTLDVDTVIVGPDKLIQGIIDGPETVYTPTIANDTNMNVKRASYYVKGRHIYLLGEIGWNGNGSGGAITFSLPSGYTIASTTGGGTSNQTFGYGFFFQTGSGFFPVDVRVNSSTTVKFTQHAASDHLNGAIGTNGSGINFQAIIPIVELQNTTALLSTTEMMNVIKKPTVQKFTSGSGTYTTPTSPAPAYIKIKMVGGGGGGGSSGSAGWDTGDTGGTTTFGSSLLTATGGVGGAYGGGAATGGVGGTSTINSPAITITAQSGTIGNGSSSPSTAYSTSVSGGNSPFAGAGPSGYSTGVDALVNTGSGGGGGGGGLTATQAGHGGGSGGYIEALITGPSATYSYAVGAGGDGGTAGTNGTNGGKGGSGIIIVEEYYLPDFSVYSVYGQTELVESKTASETAWPSLGTTNYSNFTSISLTAGEWDISAFTCFQNTPNASGAAYDAMIAISIYSGNTTTDHVNGDNVATVTMPTTQYEGRMLSIPKYNLTLTAATTVYLKERVSSASASNVVSHGYKISARRIK